MLWNGGSSDSHQRKGFVSPCSAITQQIKVTVTCWVFCIQFKAGKKQFHNISGRATGTITVHWSLGLGWAGAYSFLLLTLTSSFCARPRNGLSLSASPGTSVRSFGKHASFLRCTAHITQCLLHREGETQLLPFFAQSGSSGEHRLLCWEARLRINGEARHWQRT